MKLLLFPALVVVTVIQVFNLLYFMIWQNILLYLRDLFIGREKQQIPKNGCIYISGCDSGMGLQTALHLTRVGYTVVAGVYQKESMKTLPAKVSPDSKGTLMPIVCDITNEESVKESVKFVKGLNKPLYAVINCAGLGFTGPCEYFPIDDYRRALETNLLGYIRVAQSMLPLVKEAVQSPNAERRGRLIFIGTGGGTPSPSPALLSAYMASKWGIEAFCQSLRLEMKLKNYPIDCCMLNPGFIKPTNLIEVGNAMVAKMWKKLPPQAYEEYGALVENFQNFSAVQPATHVSVVATTMEKALTDGAVPLRYKVGFDSKASTIVGLLPTEFREWVLTKSMYQPQPGASKEKQT